MKLTAILVFLLVLATAYAEARPPRAKLRTGRLTAREVKLLNKLHSYNSDFIFSKRVNRYYTLNAYGQESLFSSEIVFDKKNSPFIKVDGVVTPNIAYRISFVNWGISEGNAADGLMVTYYYTVGRLFTCEGVAIVDDHQVVDTSCSCGFSGDCDSETRRNGVLLRSVPKARAKHPAIRHPKPQGSSHPENQPGTE